jgi:NADPH2:quinone reductase
MLLQALYFLTSTLSCPVTLQAVERNSMKAVGYYKSKPVDETDSLIDLTLPIPTPSEGELLVKVLAISVNPVDTKQRKRKESSDGAPVILGWDVAGVVEKVGSAVQEFKAGDSVYYAGSILKPGGNSEYHLVDQRIVSKKPESLSFEEAAALPLTILTAYEGLFDQLGIRLDGSDAGRKILIIGGGGGVGSMAIQLAKLAGLRVITTSSRAETTSWVKKLGADLIVDHRQKILPQLTEMEIQNVDFIFNAVNTETYWEQMAELIRPFGKIVSIVESSQPLDLTLLMRKSVSFSWELMFTRSMFETPDIQKQQKILSHVAALIDEGRLQSTLHTQLSPISAKTLREAHAALESGKTVGKMVLSGW